MGLIGRFLRKQKEEQLTKQSEKQKAAPKVLKSKVSAVKTVKDKKDGQEAKGTVEIKKPKNIKSKYDIDVNAVLIKPLITEKISDGAVLGKYAFAVSSDANKLSVKKAVSNLYGVKVLDVRMINVIGKSVRYGKSFGKRKDWKKATVTLAPGEKIEIYEGV